MDSIACIERMDSNTVRTPQVGAVRVNADEVDALNPKRACCARTLRTALVESVQLLTRIRSDIEAGAEPVARINLALARLHQRLREATG